MFKQLINKLRSQLRQTVDFIGGLFRKEHGDQDFSFFFKITRFVPNPRDLELFRLPTRFLA